VEFCEAVRQRGAGFISRVLSIKESNLDIESKNRLKDLMYQEITREHEDFFSKWRLSAKGGFSSDWSVLELIYDPPTASITLRSIEEASINPSDYPERVHTTSDLLRYIASLLVMVVGNMGLLEWYADNYPLIKLIVEFVDEGTFDMDRIRINIKDYEEWDYDNGSVDEEVGRFKPQH
jgi:hypothetical protein